jgi:hypothetical protein
VNGAKKRAALDRPARAAGFPWSTTTTWSKIMATQKTKQLTLDNDLIDIIETLITLEAEQNNLESHSDEWYHVEEAINEKQRELAFHILWEYKAQRH